MIVIEEAPVPASTNRWFGSVIAAVLLLDVVLVAGHLRPVQPQPKPPFVITQTGSVEGTV